MLRPVFRVLLRPAQAARRWLVPHRPSQQIAAGLVALALSGGLSGVAQAVTCEKLTFEGANFSVCRVDPTKENLSLVLDDPNGTPYGQFATLQANLAGQGKKLVFAMNAGMFHPDFRPVGHYVEDGKQRMRVIPTPGPGNFGLLPNGVFCIQNDQAHVIETERFLTEKPACRDATQSGPMLVIDGALHPKFRADSTSRYVRNGVGSNAEGTELAFVISDWPVTFHQFARVFRDVLNLPEALYFDGNVSRLYAPQLGRADRGRPVGPMVIVTEPIGS